MAAPAFRRSTPSVEQQKKIAHANGAVAIEVAIARHRCPHAPAPEESGEIIGSDSAVLGEIAVARQEVTPVRVVDIGVAIKVEPLAA
jgi:hypothetical protein